MKTQLSLCGIVLIAALPVGAGERLSLKVSPAVSFAPANLVVRAFVEANAANRSMEIEAESPDFYRRSEVQLDGDKAPHTTFIEFHSLPPGIYQVRATLIGARGEERAFARSQINVMSAAGQ